MFNNNDGCFIQELLLEEIVGTVGIYRKSLNYKKMIFPHVCDSNLIVPLLLSTFYIIFILK